MNFTARYVADVGIWHATCWFLPHLGGVGKTEDEAISSLKDLVSLWVEERIEELGDSLRIAEGSRRLYGSA